MKRQNSPAASCRIALLLMVKLAALLHVGSTACRAQEPVTSATQQQWGEEALAVIDRDLWLADRGLYAEGAQRRGAPSSRRTWWSAGVQLTALAAAARLNPDKYQERLTQYADALQVYWKEHDGIAGYDVLPAPAEPDRYYDDNAWIVPGAGGDL